MIFKLRKKLKRFLQLFLEMLTNPEVKTDDLIQYVLKFSIKVSFTHYVSLELLSLRIFLKF